MSRPTDLNPHSTQPSSDIGLAWGAALAPERRTAMQFGGAALQGTRPSPSADAEHPVVRRTPAPSPAARLTLIAYNVLWWIPVLAAPIGVISYRVGFVAFLAITVVRALVNAYRINAMPIGAAERLPLRSP